MEVQAVFNLNGNKKGNAQQKNAFTSLNVYNLIIGMDTLYFHPQVFLFEVSFHFPFEILLSVIHFQHSKNKKLFSFTYGIGIGIWNLTVLLSHL